MELSPGNYRDWNQQARSFAAMSAFTGASANLTGPGQPERLDGAQVETDLFSTLGVHAALGRTFVPADSGGPRPVILADRLWRSLFDADPGVLGRSITFPRVTPSSGRHSTSTPRPTRTAGTPSCASSRGWRRASAPTRRARSST
jgi:hypothetical protein